MCEYCKDGAFNTLIENDYEEYASNIFGNIWINEVPNLIDCSLVLEIRCGSGYLRLGDRGDMNCIDTDSKFKIKYCPMCGRELCE